MHTHVIPSLSTITREKTKNQVQQDLDSYFKEFMHISTGLDLPISVDVMCKYVASLTTLKKMLFIISNELDRGAQVMYPDAMEARFRF